MNRNPAKLIPADFPTLPGLNAAKATQLSVGDIPVDAQAVGYLVPTSGRVPSEIGLERDDLEVAGFTGKVGEALLLVRGNGPDVVAVGCGDSTAVSGDAVREIAAALVNEAKHCSKIALVAEVDTRLAVEGALLARYRYLPLKSEPDYTALQELVLPGGSAAEAELGRSLALSTIVARDLTNTPPGHLTASDFAEIARHLGYEYGFGVEVFDKDALIEMGCGGLLGVNRGSFEQPRLIKVTWKPEGPGKHLGLVGKGITYDSGGVNLKPAGPGQLLMKMDMGGAASVLGAFCGLRAAKVKNAVTGWLLCTDNMISGDAYRMGDVLVARDGTTVEIKNTDAEGRIVMMDGIALAVEEGVDAIIDIATLTGAAITALGPQYAATFTQSEALGQLIDEASAKTGDKVWRLPLEEKYRALLDSDIADISNASMKPVAGAITAALFLKHFAKDAVWGHIDMAGPMNVEKTEGWRPVGATGFGARLLVDVAANL